MNNLLSYKIKFKIDDEIDKPLIKKTFAMSVFLGTISSIFSFLNDYILAYGDAESHLNIAKRVVSGLVPGLAQLGGVWLPLPHILLIPFVYFDSLWQTGLAGSIVSGVCFAISAIFIYKLTFLLVNKHSVSFLAAVVFITNPNILYLQSTPMSELPLIAFFLLNIYFFIKYLKKTDSILFLVSAAFFGFLASLSRYDGWFLVIIEALFVLILNLNKKGGLKIVEGNFLLFSSLAFYGMFLWIIWNYIIFKTPFYFLNSQFSAGSQQLAWLLRNELPAYKNIVLSFLYYFVTALSNSGIIIFAVAIMGLVYFLINKNETNKFFITLTLLSPFIFYVISLFLGQSVIFIPILTPESFEWRLFNVRYGVMMVPAASIFFAYFFKDLKKLSLIFVSSLLVFQTLLYVFGASSVISLADGVYGLSAAKKVDAEEWMKKNYDGGLVLLDDYSRTLSVIRSNIKMKDLIYIGTKPYWEESLDEPEKYAKWIVMQKEDEVWKKIYDRPEIQARLYKYFNKVYTSNEILIFKRI